MKRTSPAKNRLKANVIKNKFQEDPSMRLPSRLIWRFCRHFLKLILSNHLSNLLPTLISRIFQLLLKIGKRNFFSVKSSWEVHWIVMFQCAFVRVLFFISVLLRTYGNGYLWTTTTLMLVRSHIGRGCSGHACCLCCNCVFYELGSLSWVVLPVENCLVVKEFSTLSKQKIRKVIDMMTRVIDF